MPKISTKCQDCSTKSFRKHGTKPKCYKRDTCAKKRSYYRKIEYYRQKLREYHRYLKFKGDRCALCKAVDNLEVHHIEPQARQGRDIPGNVLTLCKSCHKTITAYTRALGIERILL